ncbi:UDP-2,3-diacylglucosamine diphosphatase [Marinomonas ostreistagni]|uniref:UDP-2,3-diacylglucosamine diphosphatase n=1 Tax=Marinomonas ostreistagni TaxID=359209 RepID=UPI00194E9FE0|nr:UDP-2,3-diacylglucosamine diphosphatase [Marinomonas ostreistagni]MBM6550171.1 UDP-2,3-diacylglucosamine diphosphatase [Marinomonas ostreistagni]
MVRYFISDLHLSDKRLDLIQAFVHLTDELCQLAAQEPSQLYILGDFFEAYIGDDYQPQWITELDQQLVKLAEHGIEVFFIAGNRDFLVGPDWFARTQVTELAEQSVLDDHIVMTHGDEFCIDDHAYQEFRAMVRQPAWQQQVLAMPLEQRIALAQKLRNDSQSMSADKADNIMDVNQTAIAGALPDDTKLLIHGHTHRPALHESDPTPRLVLGDWDDNIWIAVQAGAKLEQRAIPSAAYLSNPVAIEQWQAMHLIRLS